MTTTVEDLTPAATWRHLLTDLSNRHTLDNLPSPNRIHRIPVDAYPQPLVSLDLPSVDAARQWLQALGGGSDATPGGDLVLVDYVVDYRGWSVLIHGAGRSTAQVAEACLSPDSVGVG